MTIASIVAFLSFLTAFNVPPSTVDQIQTILMATQATSTQAAPITLVPVIQTPIVPNQPVYIGGAAISVTPASTPVVTPEPVVETPAQIVAISMFAPDPERFGNIDGTMYRVITDKTIDANDITVGDPDATLTLYASGDSGGYGNSVYNYGLHADYSFHYDYIVKSNQVERQWYLNGKMYAY